MYTERPVHRGSCLKSRARQHASISCLFQPFQPATAASNAFNVLHLIRFISMTLTWSFNFLAAISLHHKLLLLPPCCQHSLNSWSNIGQAVCWTSAFQLRFAGWEGASCKSHWHIFGAPPMVLLMSSTISLSGGQWRIRENVGV